MRLLGGLAVEGRRPAEVGSRKARTLLAALAVVPGQAVAADVLAEVLWGEHLPGRPVDQLGVIVSRLRGVLGPERIIRVDAGYRLQPSWVDVDELLAGAATSQRHLAAGDALSARLAATMALDLVAGPLLPEEEAPWFDQPRSAAARSVAAANLVVAEAALLAGDPLGAAAAASLGLDHDPYDEAALRALMRAHASAGRPASALAAYAAVRRRLADDLGVPPDERTEALHDQLLGVDAGTGPARVDGWDPLVQRARVELASNDVAAARRDAQEAVRRGGGPGALELAGWTAYYERDFPAALRWAEEAAARATEEERRSSSRTLAARIRHSTGDLHGAEDHLDDAVRSRAPGVRAMAEVWLGALRAHQGRPAEALALARRGSIDEAALRHPFLMAHAQLAQVYALAQQGRVAEVLEQLDTFDATLIDLGEGGTRYQPAAANFRAWVLASIGQRAAADACSERAMQLTAELTNSLQEPRAHAVLDLARSALDAGEVELARSHLDSVEIPREEDGTMVWHQCHRRDTLRARLYLLDGDADAASALAEEVVVDAAERGARRAELLARAVVLEAQARGADGLEVDEAEVRATLRDLRPLAGLERWRVAASLAAATGGQWLWDDATSLGAELAAVSGGLRPDVQAWVTSELTRLGRP